MARLLARLSFWLVVALCLTPLFSEMGPRLSLAQDDDSVEDAIEGEEDGLVEEEDEEETVTLPDTGKDNEDDKAAVSDGKSSEEEEEEEEDTRMKASLDAETTILFTDRPQENFVAGQLVQSLIGLYNKGKQHFVVSGIEASFRYPQDYSYFIQNFSMTYLETYVPPDTQASFVYNFKPSESFYSRPFGLVVNIYYKDLEGNQFVDAVFNNTVNIVELEEGFDAETFFMYMFMVSGLCLFMFIVHYAWTTVKRPGRSLMKKAVETGTQNKHGDIDYDWLPDNLNPKKSPRATSSPRSRKKKQAAASTPDVD